MAISEKKREYNRKWQAENKTRIASYGREWYEKNREEKKAKKQAYVAANKEKVAAGHKRYYLKNKGKIREQVRNHERQRKYGLTSDDYAIMLVAQDYQCAICGNEFPDGKEANGRPLAIDHDWATGKVRGLLCGNCNRGLGCFKDNQEALQSAIAYLDKHKE